MRLIPKNWQAHQHYKNRTPPWIKLHRGILDDRHFACLPIASKALAPLLWLLASESKDGSFDASIDELVFRLRFPEKDLRAGLDALIAGGFLLDASTMLAPRLQPATPEREGETEGEGEGKKDSLAGFDDFWTAYDKKVDRPASEKAWKKAKIKPEEIEAILKAARAYVVATPDKTYRKNPATWINGKCWGDEVVSKGGRFPLQTAISKPDFSGLEKCDDGTYKF